MSKLVDVLRSPRVMHVVGLAVFFTSTVFLAGTIYLIAEETSVLFDSSYGVLEYVYLLIMYVFFFWGAMAGMEVSIAARESARS